MTIKKSIVLNDTKNSDKKAVLTVEGESDNVKGRIRLYNFGVEPKGILTLGVYCDGKVYKAGLTHEKGMLYTFFFDANVLSKDFSCAVVNVYNGEAKPILFGATFGNGENELQKVVDAVKSAKNVDEIEKVLDDYGVDYDDEEKVEIERAIDKEFECKDCSNCKYKKYFYSQQMVNKCDEDKYLNEEIEQKIEQTFYQEIKPQIDKLFKENKEEEYLDKIFPDSKWVKVNLDSGDYYVFGLIYQNNEVKYICYGVPGVYQKTPPRELAGYPTWLPLDDKNQEGFGYWLTYQDAKSGDSVKAIVE